MRLFRFKIKTPGIKKKVLLGCIVLAIILFAVVLTITVINLMISRKNVHY